MPIITALAPAGATAGDTAFTLTVGGSNFVASSVVEWNGSVLSTTYVGTTQLTAQVPAADVGAAGHAEVSVVNPAPGGNSGSAAFTISPSQSAGPTLVQWRTYQTLGTSASEGNSIVQFNSKTTTGNVIWVAVTVPFYMLAVPHSISITDTQNNTYTPLGEEDDGSPGYQTVAHFYAKNIAGDTTTPDTITVNWSNDNYKGVVITEISGASSTRPLVGSRANKQDNLRGGTNNITGGIVTASADQTPALIIALSMNTNGGLSDTGGSGYGAPTAGTGFTAVTQCWDLGEAIPPDGINLATLETQSVNSAGSYSATFNANIGTSDPYVTLEAVFH